MKNKVPNYLLKVSILFVAYFVTARIGLSIDAVSGFATLVWPPTGIALAALLISGYSLWPGIFFAAFLVNYSIGASIGVALAIGVGNTIGPLAATYMYKRFTGTNNFLGQLKHVLGLALFGGILSTMMSASIGTISLLVGNMIQISVFAHTWLSWWVGDMLGIIIVAPLILTWFEKEKIPTIENKRRIEAWFIFISIIIVSMLAFWDVLGGGFDSFPTSISYLVFPPLIWAALRLSPRIAATAVAVLSALAIFGTISGFGPFATDVISQGLLYLQIYLGSTAATIMILIAIVSERKTAEEKLKQLNSELEDRVKKRTSELSRAQDIIDKSFESIMIASGTKEHIIQYVNSAWEEETGWKRDEVVGKSNPNILKSGKMSQEFYQKLWGTILGGNLFSAEITNKRKDGTFYEAEINIFPITPDGENKYFVEISKDITEHNKMQAQLAEYTKGLEAMVGDRTRELEENMTDLEKLNKFMVGRELKMIELKEELKRNGVELEELHKKITLKKSGKKVSKKNKD